MCSNGKKCPTSTVWTPCAPCGATGRVVQVLYTKRTFGRARSGGTMTSNCPTCGGRKKSRIRVHLCGGLA